MRPANDNARTTVPNRPTPRADKLFAGAAAAIALAAVLAGLLITDPPWVVRKHRLDEQRTNSLGMLSEYINRYHTDNGKLPANLDELFKALNYRPYLATVDPVSGKAYEYLPGDARGYQLCAAFDLDSPAGSRTGVLPWAHKAGRQCFDLAAPANTAASPSGSVTIDGKTMPLPAR